MCIHLGIETGTVFMFLSVPWLIWIDLRVECPAKHQKVAGHRRVPAQPMWGTMGTAEYFFFFFFVEWFKHNQSPINPSADTMKRKLDENDRPSVPHSEGAEKATPTEKEFSFTELGLDPRLLQAVAKLKFEKPTLVQRKAIPLALAGQDVLCKAKTGSGKTAAYVLPVLASILKRKQVCLPVSDVAGRLSPLTWYADRTRSHNIHTCSRTDP